MGDILVRALLLALLTKETEAKADWSYPNNQGNDSDWNHIYPHCGGQNQSPINIKIDAAVLNTNLSDLVFSGYTSLQKNGTLKNTGYTIQYNPKGNDKPTLQGGPLDGSTYTLEQFHVHFGSRDLTGSEHTIDGFQYPAEIHFVHYNSDKYPSLTRAVNESDGLAVVGVFIEVGDGNPHLDEFPIEEVLYKDNVTDVPLLLLEGLLPSNQRDYYSYSGSLTTPPCYESVKWIVMKDAFSISPAQMAAFRSTVTTAHNASTGDGLADNYRSVQPLNGRQVVRNFEKEEKTTPTTSAATSIQSREIIVLVALMYVQLLFVALCCC